MHCYTVYTLLVAGLASQTLAEPLREPYRPKLARMSTRHILGLHRRDVEGYSPMEQICGTGDTCAEACGKGFKQCASKDGIPHCFNQLQKQTCCPSGSGDSCDNGYFCAADEKEKTWCCPDGMSLKECAQKYDIPGPLTSQPPPTSASTSTRTTSKSSTTTKASVTKDTSATRTSTTPTTKTTTSTKLKKPDVAETTATGSGSDETSTATSSASTNTVPATQTTALPSTALDSTSTSTLPASTSTSSISENGSGSYGPTNSLVLFIAGALVALV
ncbi:hypothetical protein GGS24DRAFT_252265 [Hypoxylon argillaceum]|nr:hypothetical protein GGS24DRAFT_252265 [Hypoxylon argillaceum]